MSGTLYIVATPIGNLSDITERAQQVLKEAEIVAVEDSRHAKVLLDKVGSTGKIFPYHDFSDTGKSKILVDHLQQEKTVALISDAGTPLISDPGYKLVRMAREANISVLPVPGPSALTAAISVAGLPTDRFSFEGFLPHKAAARRKRIQTLVYDERTLIFYESPHRIISCLNDMADVFGGERKVFIAREMTKKFEQHFSGMLSECISRLNSDSLHRKGEFVVVVAGALENEVQMKKHSEGLRIVSELRKEVSLKRAVALGAELSGARKNDLYSAALDDEGENP